MELRTSYYNLIFTSFFLPKKQCNCVKRSVALFQGKPQWWWYDGRGLLTTHTRTCYLLKSVKLKSISNLYETKVNLIPPGKDTFRGISRQAAVMAKVWRQPKVWTSFGTNNPPIGKVDSSANPYKVQSSKPDRTWVLTGLWLPTCLIAIGGL